MVSTPISALVNDIAGSVTGLVTQLLGQEGNVPAQASGANIAPVLSTIEQRNWMRLSFPYSFSVIDVSNNGFKNPFTDFALPLAPQALSQDEEPAIKITPTQGGTTVTHGGNRYFKLNIKGTTGIQPFRGGGGVNARTGQAIFQPNDLKHKSGYEVFLRLRNWFRAYYEFKKHNPQEAKGLRLVFKNYKDGEFLVVELKNFALDRRAERSFLYDYELDFKVLAHLKFKPPQGGVFDLLDKVLDGVIEAIDTARGIMLRSQGLLRQVEGTVDSVIFEPLRKTALAVKEARGVATTAEDVGKRIRANTLSAGDTFTVMSGIKDIQDQDKITGKADPRVRDIELPTDLEASAINQAADALVEFGEGLMALDSSVYPEKTLILHIQEKKEAASLPRSFYEDLIENLQRVKRNLEDFINLGDLDYDDLFDRTSTLSPSNPLKVPTPEEYEALFAFNNAIAGLDQFLSTEDAFKSSYDQRISDMVERFGGNIDLIPAPAVREIEVPKGVSIERIAQQELGDSSRWGEIAEVNNLLSPYLVEDASDTQSNVLRPGDKMLIPTSLVNGFSQAPPVRDIPTTENLSDLEKSLGTDLKLTPEFDLSLSSTEDLEVVSGVTNIAQQIILKLSYEKGDLIQHPDVGAGILPGQKFPAVGDIADGVNSTLLQDPRIDSIKELALEREGSSLFLTMTIKIKQIDIPVPVKIKVQ